MRLRPGGVRSQEILISSIILDRLDPLKVTCMTTELATGIGTGSASSFLSVTSNCTWNHAKTNSFSVSFFFLIVCFNFNFFVFDFPSVNSRAEGLQGHLTTWHFSYRNGHWPRCRTLSMQDVNYYPLRPCFYQPGIHPSSTALLPPPPWIHWQSIHSHVSTMSRHRMGPKTDRCQCHVIASKHRPSFFCNNMFFKEEDGHGRKGR